MQPIGYHGPDVIRFKRNHIVDYLVDNRALDLNLVASMDFGKADHGQLAQLVGYSVSGWGDLSYAKAKLVAKADAIAWDLHLYEQKTGLSEPQTADLAHPTQPIVLDEHGVARFQGNDIIIWARRAGRFDLDDLASRGFPAEDWEQFVQLLGVTVETFTQLGARDATVSAVREAVAAVTAAAQ